MRTAGAATDIMNFPLSCLCDLARVSGSGQKDGRAFSPKGFSQRDLLAGVLGGRASQGPPDTHTDTHTEECLH